MANTFYDRYLEAEVLAADPVKLVWLLYRGATDAVRTARQHLAQGDIRGRATQINRAWGILRQLEATLDHERGGEISRKLGVLYAYMQSRLVEANVKQADQPLEEVISLLTTLSEGWEVAFQSTDKKDEVPPSLDYSEPNGGESGADHWRAALALG